MTTNSSDDRRDYFRIDDHAGLEIKPLENDDHSDSDLAFDDNQLAPLQNELRRLDQDIRSQLATLAERERLLSNLMKSFNAKIDTLARIMAFEQNPLQPEQWHPVTLSEGGIAFPSDDPSLVEDRFIALRMTLPPEFVQPRAVAQIISISETDGRRWVHTEFTTLDDADRQLISRHVLRWQVRRRQQPSRD
ncbi:MAG: PilZ domain-containing protein [Alteromonadaceae bacterium]|nr:PilZ domain-containing protein [Alteromonadaceae bacterium]MBH85615.1 PilZ domain-containing protein [Alteromonadaceae bacterium]|tara:strand:+ start:20544 stop:21116 length:573 start_codon:yes stop_codon:yes gene_type:complete